MTALISLHTLAAIVWVGGMFFAYMALRPAAAVVLDPPERLQLWALTFKKFFPWVWMSLLVLPVTGIWMVLIYMGGFSVVGNHISIMMWGGIVMILLFLHVYFAPYRRLKLAVAEKQFEEAGKRLNQIRLLIATNLTLGLLVSIVGASGKYW